MTKKIEVTLPVDMLEEIKALATIRGTDIDLEIQKALNKSIEPIRHVVVARPVGGRACLYCQGVPPLESGVCDARAARNPFV